MLQGRTKYKTTRVSNKFSNYCCFSLKTNDITKQNDC